MAAVVMSVWLALAAVMQVTPAQNVWLKSLEGTWVIDNPRGSEADIVVTISRDPKGVLSVKSAHGGSASVTRYDPSGKDTINAAPGSTTQATFRSRVINQKLVTEIWDGEPEGPPARIETRWMESADVMVTELAKTPGGTAFNRVALRRQTRGV